MAARTQLSLSLSLELEVSDPHADGGARTVTWRPDLELPEGCRLDEVHGVVAGQLRLAVKALVERPPVQDDLDRPAYREKVRLARAQRGS